LGALIRPLPQNRIRDAIAVLSNAFVDDPIFNHFFPDPNDRSRVFALFFNDLIRANLRFGHVYCALDGENIIGAAVWRPPEAGEPSRIDRIRSQRTGRRIGRISNNAAAEVFAGFAQLEACHPSRPHWYLMFIGVERQCRAMHVGSSLMRPVLSLADRKREPCYLETPFPETRAFYQKQGFEMTRTSHPFRGAPAIWAMTREPGTGPKV